MIFPVITSGVSPTGTWQTRGVKCHHGTERATPILRRHTNRLPHKLRLSLTITDTGAAGETSCVCSMRATLNPFLCVVCFFKVFLIVFFWGGGGGKDIKSYKTYGFKENIHCCGIQICNWTFFFKLCLIKRTWHFFSGICRIDFFPMIKCIIQEILLYKWA